MDIWLGIFLRSVIESLTEFLPVSSTGHLFLFGSFFPFQGIPNSQEFDDLFDIFIQSGAILSILFLYWKELIFKAKDAISYLRKNTTSNDGLQFYLNIIFGSFPVLIIGFLFKKKLDVIKSGDNLLAILGFAWLIGGIIFLIVENWTSNNENVNKLIQTKESIIIGFLQCIALIPGVSRSAATILTARILGADKKSSAEFSFFVAIPVLTAAGLYKLFKYRHILNLENILYLGTGFFLTFIFCTIVIKWFIAYIRSHNFVIFGYYRIVLGLIVLIYFFMKH